MRDRICPVWMGYLLSHSLRRLAQNPAAIPGPYVRPGMRVADIGCGMGFFSLPLAEMVGRDGRVVCVDVRERMLDGLARRAARHGLLDRLEMQRCAVDSLGVGDLAGAVDFAVAFYVAHEAPDQAKFLAEIRTVLKAGCRLFLAEPCHRVSDLAFKKTLALAVSEGFVLECSLPVRRSHAALLKKDGAGTSTQEGSA